MTDLDFRYTIGDIEVEAFQITETSRYQDKLWPDWMDSRQFLTVDGETWITLGSEEIKIPYLGWLVRGSSGQISVVDALDFEKYQKVVQNVTVLPLAVPTEVITLPAPVRDDELLADTKLVFEMLQMDSYDEARKLLTTMLSKRTTWCNCSPGLCEKADPWSCREKSPLVKKPRKAKKKPAGDRQ